MNRRDLILAAGAAASAGALWPQAAGAQPTGTPIPLGAPAPFSRDTLVARARALAGHPHVAAPRMPKGWRGLTYEQYRAIWFRETDALWQDTPRPLRVEMMPPGAFYDRAVRLHVVEDGQMRAIGFDLALFDQTDSFPDLPVDDTLGYTGLRLRAETTLPGIYQEFAVFQGASYFRAIGRGEIYGLSARGLALDTAEANGEEFPDFTEFYIEAPAPGDRVWRLHALLDGPSVAGAYSFDIRADRDTVMDVRATLFPRRALDHVGLGPLTSMFLHDGKTPARFDDFRPAVHDSDGLSIVNGAEEQLWRPLNNPARLQVSSFVDTGPKGFGLIQRAQRYSDFADLEAQYHRRPSAWIEPAADWGPGAVTLVEIPTDREIFDNIVAYWRPRAPLPAGQAAEFAYRLTWSQAEPAPASVARVIGTRIGAHHVGGAATGARIAVIDFAPHPALPRDLSALTMQITANTGTLTPGVLQRNPETGGVRLAFTYDPAGADAVELRAQLGVEGQRVSEVWLYRWTR